MTTRIEELNREYECLCSYVPTDRVSTPSRQHPTPVDAHCEHPDIGPMRGDPVPVSIIQDELAERDDLSSAEKAERYSDLPLDAQLDE